MSFRVALMLSMLGLALAIVVPIAAIGATRVERSARQELADDLSRAHEVVQSAWEARRALEAAQSRVVAEEPRLKAVVATSDISHDTIVGVATEIDRGLGADLFLVTDAAGALLADVAHPDEEGGDLASVPMIAAAITSGEATGILDDGDQAFRAHARRIAFGQTVVGVLVLGHAIDTSFADAIEAETGAAIVVVSRDRIVARSTGLDAGPLARAVTALDRAPREVVLDGHRYLASAGTLDAPDQRLGYVLATSVDRALEPSRALIRLLYLLAALGVAVGALLALALSRALVRPLDRVVAFAARVASGDLRARTSSGGLREMRALGAALDHMAIELDRSQAAIEAKRRLEKELEVASRLQTALLPHAPSAPGLTIAARMIPATEVGGDYYDVLATPSGGAWLAIGDVAGHGLPAGIVMLMVRTAFAALVERAPDVRPAEIVVQLNRLLHEGVHGRLRGEEHVTFCALRYEGEGRFVFAGAHEDIIVFRSASGRCERIATSGTWLAVTEAIESVTRDAALRLAPDDVMVLMTDGAFEGEREDGAIVGLDALVVEIERVGRRDPAAILDHLLAFVAAIAREQRDDVTLVVVRREVSA